MQLQLSTWPEVESYLEKSTGIIVPIGSTEQHGPTGLIGTGGGIIRAGRVDVRRIMTTMALVLCSAKPARRFQFGPCFQ